METTQQETKLTAPAVERAGDFEVRPDTAAEPPGPSATSQSVTAHDRQAPEQLATLLRDRAHAARASARRALRGIWGLILLGLVLFVATPYYARVLGADALKRTAEGLSEAVAVYGPHNTPPVTGGSTRSPTTTDPDNDPFEPVLDELRQLEQQARAIVRTQGLVAFDAAVQSGRGVDYDAIAARLIGSLFVVFLVRIMLQVYRSERRYAAFCDARADGLILGALASLGYRDAAELMGTERLLEDAPVTAPYEWLASVANRVRSSKIEEEAK